ncbi:MAG: SH3 domain-containing protein [Candidatus Nanopelagicales bacterium]
MKALMRLALAGLMIAGGGWSIAAQAAEATASVNVRSGPGVGYAVVDVLSAGEQVDIDRCVSNGWCYVIKAGPDGWVSGRYLTDDDIGFVPLAPRPDISLSFGIPGFTITFGDGGFGTRPPRPGTTARVCFYEDVNYGGDRFCMRPGESLRRLGSWNDEISSIRVFGGAEALACRDVAFGGRCAIIDRNVRDLGFRADDTISSIRVR